ncbi:MULTISPECIES: leucine-rich repeat-containing protein kinase family protein [Marinomonas]|uniref:Protein kinase n=1 Tax=Marinomonas arctica TaxID=383750 RepID=A0A7H1J9F0_9GAMM|nr:MULTISPECIES: leucine-rich repeat-containing protein kinase family protein [Marinomonas]MCS7485252.1 protein kinase [Marinomonas sp. BSi20414]QNT07116.1 protein kinase [Marinomonas arctica]GGN23986.1 serine/threonine protein kinase [Marinomonas arctica]
MHTLDQLNRGELKGVVRLQLSDNLTTFPEAIFDLADSLEILDLSNNKLSELPADLSRLKKLRILFCSNNRFTHLPKVLGQCESLEMIGFKSNQITTVSSDSLPTLTRWLILTDNKIDSLPEDVGKLVRLQKLALAGNRLTALPDSIANCRKLELLRLSANQLAVFPDILLTLPRLAWLAFSGNPFCAARDPHNDFKTVQFRDLELHQVLGQGASGVISLATWRENIFNFSDSVAVKVFKGDVTSDGFPEDELDACLAVGNHNNLVQPLAKVTEQNCSALVMELIPSHYTNLGKPPSLESCTRDTFALDQRYSMDKIAHIIAQVDQLVAHFCEKKVSHGDLYAHNALINEEGHILFGDFGAASKYANLSANQQHGIERIERRALGFFIDDMLGLCIEEDRGSELYKSLQSHAFY